MRQIILDTETTGLSPNNGDRIVEIAALELLNRRLTGQNLHYYFDPERDSHPDALNVHGLTREFLTGKPKFETLADAVLEFLRGADELLIHNATFDVQFLDMELARCGKPSLQTLGVKVVDTLQMAKQQYPGKRNSLDALCERLGVNNSQRTLHGALLDAGLLAQVYLQLTRGQDGLLDDPEGEQEMSFQRVDYSRYTLTLLDANAQELSEHERLLKKIDADSKGKTVWRAPASSGTT